jgi:RimJ/RimL family protein N-acetyltransferase
VARRLPFPDPPLADELVALRPWARGDVKDLARVCRDPEIPKYTRVPLDYTPEIGAFFVEGSADRARDGVALELAVVAAAGGELLASVGLHQPSGDDDGGGGGGGGGSAEIGYWTAREARGRGVATRATRLLAGYALGPLRFARVEIAAFLENEPSQRVALSAGFERVGVRERYLEHRGAMRDCVLFELAGAG